MSKDVGWLYAVRAVAGRSLATFKAESVGRVTGSPWKPQPVTPRKSLRSLGNSAHSGSIASAVSITSQLSATPLPLITETSVVNWSYTRLRTEVPYPYHRTGSQ